MPTFNILTIDGGGLRGIVPIRFLQKIEEMTGKKIQDSFDMFAGTSTGGMIAACLSLRDEQHPGQPKYTLDQIADIYINKGKLIFPPKSGLGKIINRITTLFSPAYGTAGIDKVLREYVSEQRIKDGLRPLLIASYELTNNQPLFFKSAEAAQDESANAKVYDVCRATSAAPTYLPAYSFIHKNKKITAIDGGVYVNNPTMAALAEISKFGNAGYYKKRDGTPVQFDDVRVLSLGTGNYFGTVTEEEAVSWGQLQWIQSITNIMMAGVNQSTHYEANEMLDPGKYLRLNMAIGDEKYSDMADCSDTTRAYLENEIVTQITSNTIMMDLITKFIAQIS